MADEDRRQRALAAYAREKIEDLRLHGDVERRRRLVEQQSARRQDEGAGDRHALALPAGQLMRIAKAMARIETDVGERRENRRVALGDAVNLKRLAQRAIDRPARMQRAVGILEHVLQAPPLGAIAL